MEAQKLIQQYKAKVEQLDTELGAVVQCIRKARHENENYMDLLQQRMTLSDKKQIYYQFIKDLEDLL